MLQVWGIGSEDRTIYFRHGVTPTEITGNTWVPVCAQLDSGLTTNRPRSVTVSFLIGLAVQSLPSRWRHLYAFCFVAFVSGLHCMGKILVLQLYTVKIVI